MEYEIADRPQAGEDDLLEHYETGPVRRRVAAPGKPGGGDQYDRAVAIPEQEAGS